MDEQQNQKSSDYLYLDRLQFNPELKKSWLNFFITKFRVVILMIMLLTAWGIYSYIKLPLESNPEVKIPYAVVITTYPGAAPTDIEELVTKKIETKVAGLKDINTITSNSSNSLSTVTVEFNASADLTESIRNLRDAINTVKTDLPANAQTPIVQEISFDDTPIFSASIFGPFDGFTLRNIAEDMQAELEKIPGVRQVNVSGGDTSEFSIAYDPTKLVLFNISADQANQTIAAANIVIPAGTYTGSKYVYPVRADARFYDEAALRDIPISHTDDGAIIYLKDLAEVREQAIEKTVYSRFSALGSTPQNAVTIGIIKKTGGSIVETGDQAKATIAQMLKLAPAGINYDISLDSSQEIKDNFAELKRDFAITILLVFSILFIIVGLKEAFVAGLAVPLVFFTTFGVMLYLGVSLNFLSMFSLILALGLLVDDAIVVVSATKQYMNTGKFTPEEAVLLVLNDFKIVLTTTTATTVWAFLPLLSSSGILGEFLKSIPITVSITLISSLLIALMINHPLAAVLERIRITKKIFWSIFFLLFVSALGLIWLRNYYGYGLVIIIFIVLSMMIKWLARGGREKLIKNYELIQAEWRDPELIKQKLREKTDPKLGFIKRCLTCGLIPFEKIVHLYGKYVNLVLATAKRRLAILTIVGIVFLAALALPATGIVPSEFFPVADFNYLFINITTPVGTNLNTTDQVVAQVENKLLKYSEIANFSTLVGTAGMSQSSFTSSISTPANQAQITVKFKDLKERKKKSYILADDMRQDLNDIKDATIMVTVPEAGPPSGSAFQAEIKGDDLEVLDKIARDLKPVLTSIKGVVNPDISLKDSPAEYTFTFNPARLELYNLNAAYVATMLRLAISGADVSKVLLGGKEIKVVARFDKNKVNSLAAMQNLEILNLRKQPVFLKDVATIELKPSVESIARIDQKRTITLTASVNSQNRPNAVLTEFQNNIRDYQLPKGYTIDYGGLNQQNVDSVTSIIRAMAIAVLLIISTLVIQFNSFKKAIIVLVTIPLALIGVFFGLAIAHLSLSFPGLIGIVALFGIVVKNAIILVDKINLNIHTGIQFKEAIIDAGKSRLEAIFLTSICTIVGIIPITLSNETWTALGGAVIFGLLLSSFLTLFIIPILYMTFVRPDERL